MTICPTGTTSSPTALGETSPRTSGTTSTPRSLQVMARYWTQSARSSPAETGVRFAVIHGSDKSFVVGSHGLTSCDLRFVGDYLAGAVLPLAHDVLAHITPWPCTPGLLILGNTAGDSQVIDAVNQATATQSLIVAGNSETPDPTPTQLIWLTRRHPGAGAQQPESNIGLARGSLPTACGSRSELNLPGFRAVSALHLGRRWWRR